MIQLDWVVLRKKLVATTLQLWYKLSLSDMTDMTHLTYLAHLT